MRTLLLTDHVTCRDEHDRLARLSIALSDAGVAAVLATPDHHAAPPGVLCSTVVPFASRGMSLSLTRRVREFLARLPDHFSLTPNDDDPADDAVVHVLGRGAWAFAVRLHEQTGVPLVFEVAGAADVEPLAHEIRRNTAPGAPVVVISPGERLSDQFRRSSPTVPVVLARWGVHAAASLAPRSADAQATSLGILAPRGGSHDAELRHVLSAISSLAPSHPDVLIFLDSRAAEHHAVWRTARRLGLLGRLTLVSDVEHRAEHFLQTSFIVVPQRLGGCRSILLSAMALGTPIVARADPDADWLISDRTAILAGDADRPGSLSSRAWAEVLQRAIADPSRLARVRGSAHEYVREYHSVPAYVRALIHVYERVVASGADSPANAAS